MSSSITYRPYLVARQFFSDKLSRRAEVAIALLLGLGVSAVVRLMVG